MIKAAAALSFLAALAWFAATGAALVSDFHAAHAQAYTQPQSFGRERLEQRRVARVERRDLRRECNAGGQHRREACRQEMRALQQSARVDLTRPPEWDIPPTTER